ncbi:MULTISPECIES: hypothetical protein [unclassified Alteromonas]|uniref:hypothetical protein n=1 Tax=unclassified Alteromonas TaxID=2614992 RepID=UPI001EF36654|nr:MULTISPECIES: hypothetical protein [unclassified Alteromonas]MCG7638093.1 hypothetical protein [Alteromonas sp. CNT1-28]MCG7813721.1 hypothetical protein [Alteromonas sp. MCA-1]
MKTRDDRFTSIPKKYLRDSVGSYKATKGGGSSEHEYGLPDSIFITDVLPSNNENLPTVYNNSGKVAAPRGHNSTDSGEPDAKDTTANKKQLTNVQSTVLSQTSTCPMAKNIGPAPRSLTDILNSLVMVGILIVSFVVFRHLRVALKVQMQHELTALSQKQNPLLDGVLRPIRLNSPLAFDNDTTSFEQENGELQRRLNLMGENCVGSIAHLENAQSELANNHHKRFIKKARYQELTEAMTKLLGNLSSYLRPRQARNGFLELVVNTFNERRLQQIKLFITENLKTENHLRQMLSDKKTESGRISAELSRLKHTILVFYSSLLKIEYRPYNINQCW